MDEEEDRKALSRLTGRPASLEGLSLSELSHYDAMLQEERQRVAAEITRKQSIHAAAHQFFKA